MAPPSLRPAQFDSKNTKVGSSRQLHISGMWWKFAVRAVAVVKKEGQFRFQPLSPLGDT